jgi:plastocyanin
MRRALWLCAVISTAIAGTILVAGPAGAGGGCHAGIVDSATTARLTGASGTAVIEDCAFKPTVLYVDEGAEVTWVNKDIFDHTVTGANFEWGSEAFLAKGDTIKQTFKDEGVYPFFCLLHPGMVGTVVVGDPDPDDVGTKLSSIDSSGIELGTDDGPAPGAEAPAAAPRIDGEPASDSIPSSLVLGTIAVLALAAGVAFTLVRRRGRVEQGV